MIIALLNGFICSDSSFILILCSRCVYVCQKCRFVGDNDMCMAEFMAINKSTENTKSCRKPISPLFFRPKNTSCNGSFSRLVKPYLEYTWTEAFVSDTTYLTVSLFYNPLSNFLFGTKVMNIQTNKFIEMNKESLNDELDVNGQSLG